MEKKMLGTLPSGMPIEEYTLRTETAEVAIMTLGGIITRFVVCGIDIMLGWSKTEDYFQDGSHQGALIGRYANRIKGGRFSLNGKEYILAKNNGNNHLHGGTVGFDRKIWRVESATDAELALTLSSCNGDEGYPGNLEVKVIYRLVGGSLLIDYFATTDADTVCNMTNHAYFNLDGCGCGDVKAHRIVLHADRVTAVDRELIPTGEHIPVGGTPLDFLTAHTIGERLSESFAGYDHNYVLSPSETVELCGYRLPLAATVEGKSLRMTVATDQPCLQLYTPSSFGGDSPRFKDGSAKRPFAGFCMEAQLEPDSPNRGGGILRAGETYRHRTVYSVERI